MLHARNSRFLLEKKKFPWIGRGIMWNWLVGAFSSKISEVVCGGRGDQPAEYTYVVRQVLEAVRPSSDALLHHALFQLRRLRLLLRTTSCKLNQYRYIVRGCG
uniref:Ribosomal RNA small subunit methyltransferase H n=1 Tax=Anthurium amnicola TaxID=1678845 RepID=A0A1D1YLM1_9ARAE